MDWSGFGDACGLVAGYGGLEGEGTHMGGDEVWCKIGTVKNVCKQIRPHSAKL